MKIISPRELHIPALRVLWKEAFGDSDEFLDNFFETGFSPDRCFCSVAIDTVADGTAIDDTIADIKIASALYWFDCEYMGKPMAYLYAIATAKECRGQGLCQELMTYTHTHLENLGYAGAILVPGSKELFDFYDDMGYTVCCYQKKVECTLTEAGAPSKVGALLEDDTLSHSTALPETSGPNFSLTPITKEIYARLRRNFLPEGSVIQEGESIDFLATQCSFYTGNDFLLAIGEGDTNATMNRYACPSSPLLGLELLGNITVVPQILQALGYKKGTFRVPGMDIPFAMYKSLGSNNLLPPKYFGFAFD